MKAGDVVVKNGPRGVDSAALVEAASDNVDLRYSKTVPMGFLK